MTLDIDNIYKTLLGRAPKKEGRDFWGKEYANEIANNISHDQARAAIIGSIKQSDEYKDLDFPEGYDHTKGNNKYAAEHKVQALKSIMRGQGVRDGTIPSYDDMFHADGTKRDDWVDVETWNVNKITDLQNQLANKKPVDDERYKALLTSFNDLQGVVGGLYDSFGGLQQSYASQIGDLKAMYADQQRQAADQFNAFAASQSNRTRNPTVRGVRTQNEFPSYTPKTGGAGGFFGRGAGRGLTTGALNLA